MGKLMYPHVTTVNPIGGSCEYQCAYCVTGETKILTKNYTEIPISEIKIGHEIIGIQHLPKQSGIIACGIVTNVATRTAHTLTIYTEDSKLECTQEHPLYVNSSTRSQWSDYKTARSVTPYDCLRFVGRPLHDNPTNISNYTLRGIKRSEVVKIKKGSFKQVFNIETTTGNYIANGVLVHNCYITKLKERFGPIKKKFSGLTRIDKEGLNRISGSDKVFFISSSNDISLFTARQFNTILERCRSYDNYYLFHTKNSYWFCEWSNVFPDKSILATTIETNRDTTLVSRAPAPRIRRLGIKELQRFLDIDAARGTTTWTIKPRIMIAVEPIMDFDVEFLQWLIELQPDIVVIGADSGNNDLSEPGFDKLVKFIRDLTAALPCVRLKDTLFARYPNLPYEHWTDNIWEG